MGIKEIYEAAKDHAELVAVCFLAWFVFFKVWPSHDKERQNFRNQIKELSENHEKHWEKGMQQVAEALKQNNRTLEKVVEQSIARRARTKK